MKNLIMTLDLALRGADFSRKWENDKPVRCLTLLWREGLPYWRSLRQYVDTPTGREGR